MRDDAFMGIEWDRMAICLKSNRASLGKMMRRVGPSLEALRDSIEESGAELVVFLIPDEFQVDDELSARLLEINDTDPADFARAAPQRKLVNFLESAGIHHIDGLQRFRSKSGTESLYLPRNTHWNAAGNALGARMIARYILDEGLLASE